MSTEGFLPAGIHDATIEEVAETFGGFQSSDRRPFLMSRLRGYMEELRAWGHAEEVLLDGSFISMKTEPSDIDIILVYPAGFDPVRPVVPSEYNVTDRRRVRRLYGFDVILVAAESFARSDWINYFSQDTRTGQRDKGLIRLKP